MIRKDQRQWVLEKALEDMLWKRHGSSAVGIGLHLKRIYMFQVFQHILALMQPIAISFSTDFWEA